MACMENYCTRFDCSFGQFSNEVIKVCPKCGDRVLNFFDEFPPEEARPAEEIDVEEDD